MYYFYVVHVMYMYKIYTSNLCLPKVHVGKGQSVRYLKNYSFFKCVYAIKIINIKHEL